MWQGGWVKRMVFLWRACGVLVVGVMVFGQIGIAQQTATQQTATPQTAGKPTTAKPKPKTAVKPGMAVWSPEVQKTLGVTAENFNAEGLNKLTPAQLTALLISARLDPRKGLLMCPVSGTAPAGRVKVLVTVAGDDPTGAIATAIKESVAALNGVDVVDSAATADRALHVVVQEQTVNKRTIGFTASYLTATPCSEEIGGKKTDVELKGTLGTYSNAKGPGLAKDLAGMMDQDLQTLRTGGTK
jgi:hypothetical protein